MSSLSSKNGSKPPTDPKPASVFPAFPEPQAWALNWDSTGLAGVAGVRHSGASAPKPAAPHK